MNVELVTGISLGTFLFWGICFLFRCSQRERMQEYDLTQEEKKTINRVNELEDMLAKSRAKYLKRQGGKYIWSCPIDIIIPPRREYNVVEVETKKCERKKKRR